MRLSLLIYPFSPSSPPPSSIPDYLLSNNHINSIIVLKLDFSDEEVLAYYISFLKTLSFKLNKHTIHFFFNEVGGASSVLFVVYVSMHQWPSALQWYLYPTAPEGLSPVHRSHQVFQPQ